MMIALIIFAVGLTLVPMLLDFVGSGLQTSRQVYDKKANEQYAADAGVARAMWHIKYQNDSVPEEFSLDLNDINTVVRITSQFDEEDNITSYYINSVAGTTAINAQINYAAEIQAIPGEPETYMFQNALATGLNGNISLLGNAVINSDSGQAGNIYCGNNLNLTGSSRIEGDIYSHNNIAMEWSTTINGDAAATGTITLANQNSIMGAKTPGADPQSPPEIADSLLNPMVQAVYAETFNIPAITPAGTTYTSNLTIKNQSGVTYPSIYVQGNLTLQNVNTNLVFAGQVYVTGLITFSGTQSLRFNGPVYAGGQLTTGAGGGTVIFQDSVCAASMNLANNFQFTFNGPVKDLGAFTVGNSAGTALGSTLYVGGNFSYGGASDLNLNSNMYIKGSLTLSNGAQINGPRKVVVRGNLTLSGDTQLTADRIPFIILPPARITPTLSPLTDPATVTLANSARASAAIYAPTAVFRATGDVRLYGSIICKSASIENSSRVTYLTGLSDRTDLPHAGTPGQEGRAAKIELTDWGVQ
jgi:predicted acyltransferase (DUF342 family)